MDNKNQHISPRRKKLIFLSCFVNIFSSLIIAIVFFTLNYYEMAGLVSFSTIMFVTAAILTKNEHPTFARALFLLTFNLSVFVISAFVGKDGSIEIFLIFAIGMPFSLYSIRREKIYAIIFTVLPIVLLIILYVTKFTFFGIETLDPLIAKQTIYPFSMTMALLLVVFQLIYFSYLSAGFNNYLHKRKEHAVESLDAKSIFLSTMSHEIRTPLNAIIGLSHVLADDNPRKDQLENIEALSYSGKILLNLLNNVLDISKMQSSEIKLDNIPTDLSNAFNQIKKVHEPSCLKKGIEMKLEIDKAIPQTYIDITRFNQVVNNLVSNSIKFTKEGSVTLKIKTISKSDTQIKLLTEIIDTGIGIPKDKQSTIWEAFSQASKNTNRLFGGTGLGLPIAKSIIQAMGSDINLDSEVGKGSKFSFTLDLEIVPDKEIANKDQIKKHNFINTKVLLAEDNEINIMVGKKILEKANLKVVAAKTGLEAVNLVKEEHFDIVLMDIQMPVMDGYTAAKEIRKFNKKIPIIALSASAFIAIQEKLDECGMNGFIYKPFDPQDLLNQIEGLVNKSK